MSIEDNLAAWPNLQALLARYLGRLGKFPPSEVEKTWLYKASRSALERSEQAAHFEALERAAGECDENARKALRKKFVDVLPRRGQLECDDGLLDSLVELAAYSWLRQEYREGKPEFVPRGNKKTPDLQLRLDQGVIGTECKDIHWLWGMDREQHGERGFHDKLKQVISDALDQLQGYDEKIIFVNYTASFQLQAEGEIPVEGEVPGEWLEAEFGSVAPAEAALVVFENYAWRQPRFEFNRPVHEH